jgi:exodeoxyribonuclease VII small subunit
MNFEKSLEQLNALVEKMEAGQLPLEASLKHFEEGIALIRDCQKELKNAEQKVQILTEQQKLEPFNDNNNV